MSTVRSRLATDLESNYSLVRDALEDAMAATKKTWGFCPKCKGKVQVDFPDHGARIRAIELWLEQGFGKPSTNGAAAVAPSQALLTDVEALTDDQLAALAWAGMDEAERARYRRLLERLSAAEFPGLMDALQRVEALAGTGG
jgi:hypothetical protein